MFLVVHLLVALSGVVVIALIAVFLLDSIIGSEYIHPGDRAEYKWLAFGGTLRVSAALAASIYGFSNASDILDSIARIIHP